MIESGRMLQQISYICFMKFGKLPSIQDVDFSLPPLNERSLARLGGKPADTFQAFVGISRWASKEWLGHIYPTGTKQADYLKFYAKAFNTIELNSTHYRIPTPEQVIKWREQTGPEFRFCPKIPQVISHYRKLVNVEEELHAFLEAISHFEDKLGCSFVQLHESFSPALFSNLEDFFSNWSAEFPLAVEFRHPDWFDNQQLIPEILDLLESNGISTVITDVAGRRDVSHTSLSTATAMIRLVGNELHESDFDRSEAWLKRIKVWQENGLKNLYFFPHQPGDRMASDFGDYWIDRLNQNFGQEISGTTGLSHGGQMALF